MYFVETEKRKRLFVTPKRLTETTPLIQNTANVLTSLYMAQLLLSINHAFTVQRGEISVLAKWLNSLQHIIVVSDRQV